MGKRIDLGCGKNKVEGCIGVDHWREVEPDIVADIRNRIQGLEDGCAEYVVCRHVLEHLESGNWRSVLTEMARLLEPGGQFEIRVPHPQCRNAMIQGHLWVLTPLWWEHFKSGMFGDFGLTVDRIEEIPWPPCVEFCKAQKLDFNEWGPYLFDAYYETAVFGHKQ